MFLFFVGGNMYIDTHCHIIKSEYDNIDEVISKLEGNIAIISGDSESTNKEVMEVIEKYPNIYGMIGIHPNEVKDMSSDALKYIEDNLSNSKIVGIGEIGLDYHYGKEDKELQKEIFIKQLDLARKYNVPVTIHSRDAAKDTFDIVKDYNDLKITYHCYQYSLEMAKELLKQNILFGIGGVLTFKNSKEIKEVVKYLPLSNILLETDSPYLAPEPLRGTKNIPSNVIYVAKYIAELKGIPLDTVLKSTSENAISQFDLPI